MAQRAQRPQKQKAKAQRVARKSRVAGAELGRLLRLSKWWLAGGLVLVHLLLAYLIIAPAPHTGGDNAAYLTLARSLLQDGSYRNLYDPALPLHTQYPPMFPIILAAATIAGLTTWMQIKFLIMAFSALGVAFTYLWIRARGRPELAFAVALIMAVAPGVLELSHWELSDVPFWAMTMVALWAWDRLRPGDYGTLAIAVLMTTAAYFTRSAGLPLLIAAGAWLIWKRRWQQLAALVVVIGPLALWWWWRARSQGGVDYVSQFWFVNPYDPSVGRINFAGLLERMTTNGGKYMTTHLPILLFGAPRLVGASILIVLLGVYGWVRRLRHARITELFTPLYIGLILVWPAVWSGERFLLPALPLILYYAGDALVRLLRMSVPAAARLVPAALVALLVLLVMPALAQNTRLSRECMSSYRAGDEYACLPLFWKDFFGIATIAPRVLPDGAVVLNRKPRHFYHASGLRGRNYPLSDDPAVFFREADDAGARYVLFDGLDGLSQAYLAPVLLTRSNSFCMLFGLGQDRAVMFGILPAAARGTARQPDAQGISFAECGPDYWRSTAARDSLMQGLIQMP